MMDELELLKKDWKKQEKQLPKLSYEEIYKMIWKKSSSIVKWIFYISIFELLFWIALNTIPLVSDSFGDTYGKLETEREWFIFNALNFFTYAVILIFIYFLYKAYKSISVESNVKTLMESILRTRKVIRYYVGYNLAMAVISVGIVFFYFITSDPETIALLETVKSEGSELKLWLISAALIIGSLVIMIGFILLFYRLVYGILLKKLHKNYTELKKLEV